MVALTENKIAKALVQYCGLYMMQDIYPGTPQVGSIILIIVANSSTN